MDTRKSIDFLTLSMNELLTLTQCIIQWHSRYIVNLLTFQIIILLIRLKLE